MTANEKMLDRINALINKANATEFDAERETFLAKADALMFQYKIDQIQLDARRQGQTPESMTTVVDEEFDWVDAWDEFRDIHTAVVAYLAYLTGVQLVLKTSTLHVFGYADDVRYFRQLWTSAFLTFSGKLNPQWNKNLSDGENIKALAESGLKWVPMWRMAQKAGSLLDVPMPPADNGKMKRLYAAACKAAGVEKMKLTHATKSYRDSFSVGFRDVVYERAMRLKADRDRLERQAGDGVSLVLRRQATAVEDAMRAKYGDLGSIDPRANQRKATNANAQAMGATAGAGVDLAGTSNVGAARAARAIG